MGLSLSFIATKGSDPLSALGLSADGKTLRAEPIPPPAGFIRFDLGDWRFVMSDDHRFASRERVCAAAQGGVAVGLYLEEHVMISGAFGAEAGELAWSVQHDPNHGMEHLDVWGEPPAALEDIRDGLLAELRKLDDADYIFSVPTELVASVCGLDVDNFSDQVDLTVLSVTRKDMMKMAEHVASGAPGPSGAAPSGRTGARPGLLARLFGRR
jgi:hypothetical protein